MEDRVERTMKFEGVFRENPFEVQFNSTRETEIVEVLDALELAGFEVRSLYLRLNGPGQRNAEFTTGFLSLMGRRGILLKIQSSKE